VLCAVNGSRDRFLKIESIVQFSCSVADEQDAQAVLLGNRQGADEVIQHRGPLLAEGTQLLFCFTKSFTIANKNTLKVSKIVSFVFNDLRSFGCID